MGEAGRAGIGKLSKLSAGLMWSMYRGPFSNSTLHGVSEYSTENIQGG